MKKIILVALILLSIPIHSLEHNLRNPVIKAVIFDCDGTLVDTERVLYDAWAFALQKQGYILSEQEYWNFLHQYPIAGLPAGDLILAEWGCELLNKTCKYELINDVRHYLADVKSQGKFPLIEGTVAFLHNLAEVKSKLGIKIGLASGNSKAAILSHLKDLGVEGYFDVIISGSEDLSNYHDVEGTNKPKPYIYLLAAEKLGISPAECVAIEDSKTGVSSAVSAGCITVAIPNIGTKHHDLSLAHLIIDSLFNIDVDTFLALVESNSCL